MFSIRVEPYLESILSNHRLILSKSLEYVVFLKSITLISSTVNTPTKFPSQTYHRCRTRALLTQYSYKIFHHYECGSAEGKGDRLIKGVEKFIKKKLS